MLGRWGFVYGWPFEWILFVDGDTRVGREDIYGIGRCCDMGGYERRGKGAESEVWTRRWEECGNGLNMSLECVVLYCLHYPYRCQARC